METHGDGEVEAVIVIHPEILAVAAFLTCFWTPASYCAAQVLFVVMGSIAEHPSVSLLS